MATKPLYVMGKDNGDGSCRVVFVLDRAVINALERKYEEGTLEYTAPGFSGEGLSYDTLNIPSECTPESLGISVWTVEDVKEYLGDDE